MEEYIIDCASIGSREALHTALAETLPLPEWYGRNLDALYDCLTELGRDTAVTFLHWSALEASLGRYAATTRSVLIQAMMNNPRLIIRFAEEDPQI